MKNAIVEFKLRFLIRLLTKCQLQALRGCRNECRRGWNQEIRGGRCLNRSIGLISNSNAFKWEEHALFIHFLGVTVRSKRSMVTMERSIMDRFEHIVVVVSVMKRSDEMHYKTL